MILNAQKAAAFLRKPDPSVIGLLVYGSDDGLVHEWVKAYGASQDVALNDPFLVVELSPADIKSDPPRLLDEASSLSFGGGMKFVRVRNATDLIAPFLETVLAEAPNGARIVVDAGSLAKTSKLRKVFEKSKRGAAVPCYADEARDLRRVVLETLKEHAMEIEPDALSYLADSLGNDRQVTRRELEKLVLYKSGHTTINLADVEACVGDNGVLSLDALIYAVADGAVDVMEHELSRLWQDGTAPVSIIRSVTRHFQRLHMTVAHMNTGVPYDRASMMLRPPVFFKYKDAFRRQTSSWTLPKLANAMEMLVESEKHCKTTGYPAETLCSRALLRLAVMAHGRTGSRNRRP